MRESNLFTMSGYDEVGQPNRLPNDPKEDLILKSVRAAHHPLIVPFYKVSV